MIVHNLDSIKHFQEKFTNEAGCEHFELDGFHLLHSESCCGSHLNEIVKRGLDPEYKDSNC
jgi:hypothetical protein